MLNFTDNSENVTIQEERVKETKIVINHKTKNIDLELDYKKKAERYSIDSFIDSCDIKEILENNNLSYEKFKKFNDRENHHEIEVYSMVIANELNELDKDYNNMIRNFMEVCSQLRQLFPSYTSNYVGNREQTFHSVIDYEDIIDWRNSKFSN